MEGTVRGGGRRRRVDSTTTTTTATTTTTPGSVAPPPTTTVRIVAYRPIDDRVELTAALDGDLSTAVDSVTLPATLAADSTLALEVPTTLDVDVPGALTLRRPGLHPVTVELLVDGEGVAEHTTFIERLPLEDDGGASLNVAIVAAVPDPGRRRRRPRSPTVATNCHGSPSWRRRSTARSRCSCRRCWSTTSTPRRRRSPRSCARHSTATRCSPSRRTCSTRRRPWRWAPERTSTRELRDGEAVLTDALPSSLPQRAAWLVPTPISTDAAAMLAGIGFRSLVLDPEIYAGLDGNIGGFHDRRSRSTSTSAGGGSCRPSSSTRPAPCSTPPSSSAPTRRPLTPPCRSSPNS